MTTKAQNGFDRQDTSALRRMLRNHKTPADFARNLVDELRDLAGCEANADTCRNKVCQLAHAIERGLEARDAFGRKAETPLRVTDKLQCPHCRYKGKKESPHGGTFRYLTDETTWRDITQLQDNMLTVASISDHYNEDEEKNDRIECRKCLREFRLSPTIEVELV